jgi:hypothetical protein
MAYVDDVSFFSEDASAFFSLGFDVLEGVLDDLFA